MRRILSNLLLIALIVLVTITAPKVYDDYKERDPLSYEFIKKVTVDFKDTYLSNSLQDVEPTKAVEPKNVIVLEEGNVAVLRGPVTKASMTDLMFKLSEISGKIDGDTPIYLFIDSPGGSVFAGLDLIDFAKSLPNKVITITKFAASMGFQIVQNLDKRYILNNGVLMSHRARGRVQGQFDGELESRYKWIKEALNRMDSIAASRMSIPYKEYKDLIVNEFWSNGFRSVNNKSADEVVMVRCGKSLKGSRIETGRSLFGSYRVRVAKCPLISGSVDIVAKHPKTKKALKKAYNNPRAYLNEYILNDKHYGVFK